MNKRELEEAIAEYGNMSFNYVNDNVILVTDGNSDMNSSVVVIKGEEFDIYDQTLKKHCHYKSVSEYKHAQDKLIVVRDVLEASDIYELCHKNNVLAQRTPKGWDLAGFEEDIILVLKMIGYDDIEIDEALGDD